MFWASKLPLVVNTFGIFWLGDFLGYFLKNWVIFFQIFWPPCLWQNKLQRGAQKLTGENLKVVWAEFSTLSQAILLCMQLHGIYKSMPQLRLANSAQVSPCWLKFVHGYSPDKYFNYIIIFTMQVRQNLPYNSILQWLMFSDFKIDWKIIIEIF